MAYWNSRGLRGSTLEEFVNITNEEYIKKNLAVIQKIPTSIKTIELDQQKGIITKAYFEQKSTVDYMGNVQGIPVCFDVKETSKLSLPISNIHEHQMSFMENFEKQNGISFIIVYYSCKEKYYFIPFKILKNYWDQAKIGGRKSIPCKECIEKYEIRKQGMFLVHYLESLSTYLEEINNITVE
ncbi:Holliday junction resolvase RecU [Alkalibaculum sp. M08DMB]|uniref:Holliday junction resolvase RecU n=1 Tax=Alkalibaculum sporogenes TaxID=2655001 RepID=A0A6A7K5H3_9FIRM|nr:Holliday junction resolvase RecU [Alkalibaculum sporogenes]MPW24594.1 Holliday junction resolvase RecU [Alkalibaculum sporogenes]